MTPENFDEIMIEVLDELAITWVDPNLTRQLTTHINTSATYLSNIGGVTLDFNPSSKERELLVQRVRYVYNSALDEFENNFHTQLGTFILDCAVKEYTSTNP